MAEITAPTILYKQPSEIRNYTMDFTELLDGTTISSIISVNHTLRGGGESDLVVSSITLNGDSKMVSFLIAGGNARNTYRIEVMITTTNGQTLEGDGLLSIVNI